MMLGTVAAGARRRIASPPDSGVAIASLDFTTDSYFAGGTSRAIGDVLTGYDVAEISASGARIAQDSAMRPRMTGALLADFAAQFAGGATVVIEFSAADTDGIGSVVQFVLVDSSSDEISLSGAGGSLEFFDATGVFVSSSDLTASGIQRVAFTAGRDVGGGSSEWALSINGATATTQTVGYDNSGVTYASGGFGPDPSYGFSFAEYFIRKITLYAAKTPGELPALSA